MEGNKNKILAAILICGLFIGSASQAATMFPSPNSGSYSIGKSFSVGVFVSSADQALNAVSGTLSFPQDKLEVTGLSTSGSIVSLWVQEPSFSNSSGTARFEGIVLNPGFQGNSGRVLTVNFRVKDSGTADVTFSAGSILANDGQGTNILSGLGSARYSIEVPVSGPAAPEAETPSPIVGTPPAPQVTSDTHPDPDKWYNINVAKFSWSLPSGVTGVRLLVGEKPQVDPTVLYTPPISSRTLDELEDGIWYFHVQLRSSAGWGGITHYRFQIDTQNPDSFVMTEIVRADLTEPQAKFKFEATDSTSGIDHYDIQIDNDELITWKDDNNGEYQTPILAPGKHTILVKAVDQAGNNIANFAEINVQALDRPVITDYSRTLTTSEPLMISGKTYPGSQVIITLRREGEEPVDLAASSDSNGNFKYQSNDDLKLVEGTYKFTAKVVDPRGAQSELTDELTVKVQKPAYWRFGSLAINVLSVIIPLIALILLLVFMLWYSWHKFKVFRQRVGKEVVEAESALRLAFASLKKNIASRVRLLEKTGVKRKLTREEEKVILQLRQDLDAAENLVAKEIKDIKKEIK